MCFRLISDLYLLLSDIPSWQVERKLASKEKRPPSRPLPSTHSSPPPLEMSLRPLRASIQPPPSQLLRRSQQLQPPLPFLPTRLLHQSSTQNHLNQRLVQLLRNHQAPRSLNWEHSQASSSPKAGLASLHSRPVPRRKRNPSPLEASVSPDLVCFPLFTSLH